MCVCVRDYSRTIYSLRSGLRAIPNASVLQAHEKNADFSETTAFERVKLAQSQTTKRCLTHQLVVRMRVLDAGSPRLDPLALFTSEAQKATAKGVYRLPHAI